jgi:hypothetical protein
MFSTRALQRFGGFPPVSAQSVDEAAADHSSRLHKSISVEWFGDEFGLVTKLEADAGTQVVDRSSASLPTGP